ncbi:[protein-PII] uridylyltransferase [Intrasporangium calvum]|uniref:Bifunctional uridylyltransferase/uridylyl-removing enzyme n=1 Tax=Intrasporangium calvum (strain ATCC 23552 / DSM 43043 / JCM 3097 / NBRC 12989 / NCIMB 10167 / NRRL B-3866 / 7 KIP) TaxID=710696 RepID=E6SF17_INTC7|nr:[protein-PII] uridylyltransferase [Intrasporangium calvum]ADU48806.1 UTP-GlnB uridylyltransferase, GlnD [Intrasporangium calvum DSM 43043]
MTDVTTRRLDLAGTRGFATPGAGPARRRALAEFGSSWLQDVWRGACGGRRHAGVALAAVGSLARGDGGPLSDFDLVLVHHPRGLAGPEVAAFADRLWYPIWDAGVRLDHSVRTVAECRAVASEDLSAAMGLLDLTHIAGDVDVVNAARSTVAHDWRANARTRLSEIHEAVTARHARQGDLAHLIEPDLKEAHGGLRDMTVLRALTEAWLTDRPHGAVDEAYERILDVRDAIHVVTGRGRDRLTRDDQDACAALLGHPDADELLTELSGAARTIAYAADSTLRRALQSQRARTLRVGPRRPQLVPLGYGLYRHDGEAVLGPSADLASDPVIPLRAALVAARNGIPLSPATLQNLGAHAPKPPEPWPEMARGVFADLLATGPGVVAVWEGLDLAGVVERWIPEWAAVRSRPQRNAVHRHTVDRHLVETVVSASGMVRDVARPDLLVLAAVLHDIGKVPGAIDHSHEGADIAERILRRIGVAEADREIVVRLVREHLTLVDLATRRDPEDPATIETLSDAVGGSVMTLDLLRALTEADASAAGPKAWSDWRAGLVHRLYQACRQALVAANGADRPRAVEPLEPLPLAKDVIEKVAVGEAHVSVVSLGGAHRIDIIDRDRAGLFADTAGLLAAHGFVVRSATVRTLDGLAVNEWWVDSPSGENPLPEIIGRDLTRVGAGDRAPLGRLQRRKAARPVRSPGSGSPDSTRAMVISSASDSATVIEVRATDRAGLLQDIGITLARASLAVRSAHIATYAGQTLDTFYVTELGGSRLAPARAAQAVAMIIDTCDGP